jgi:hypothetical protein
MKLHFEAVAPSLTSVLKRLMTVQELEPFRLVGGTALALLFGHRTSVDIDLFAAGRMNASTLTSIMHEQFGDDFYLDVTMQNGISGRVNNVKVDLFDWKVPFIHPALNIENIRLAAPPDIFAYKCEAVIDRKSEKDFSDIGEIIKHFKLVELIDTFRKRYPFISTGAVFPVLLKKEIINRDYSIQYFKDNSFETYVDIISRSIAGYEQSIMDQKASKDEERIKKIQELIEQKRNQKK